MDYNELKGRKIDLNFKTTVSQMVNERIWSIIRQVFNLNVMREFYFKLTSVCLS